MNSNTTTTTLLRQKKDWRVVKITPSEGSGLQPRYILEYCQRDAMGNPAWIQQMDISNHYCSCSQSSSLQQFLRVIIDML